METHPDEGDPARQGAYFSREPGECPWCGMHLQSLADLPWVETRRAAEGAGVAYTCPTHQHVFSRTAGDCPRCGEPLEPFKVLYTCPDPQHAGVIRLEPGKCPHCQWELAPYRGIWLSPRMADRNVPPHPEVAKGAAYRCARHPLAHSARPGQCPICAAELLAGAEVASAAVPPAIPLGATFTCPMAECGVFSDQPGSCPTCGMKLKPIDEVAWARDRLAGGAARFVCPMHPDQTAAAPGTCGVCGMQLVAAEAVPRPTSAPAAVQTQMNYLTEHYLELQKRFSSDSTKEVALHALGLVGAADELLRYVDDPAANLPAEFAEAARRLRAAALKTTGLSLDDDRVTFVELSNAMRTLVEHVRPELQSYPRLYIFHCPMTKGDWMQTSADLANPFYGFKMLKCGELVQTR